MSNDDSDSLNTLGLHSDAIARVTGANDALSSLAKSMEVNSASAALRKIALELQPVHSTYALAIKTVRVPDSVSAQIHATLTMMNEHHDAMRVALGPMEDLNRLRNLHVESILGVSSAVALARIQEQFRRPEFEEINRLASEVSARMKAIEMPDTSALRIAMSQIQSPWVAIQKDIASAQSFARLQSIGETLKLARGFDDGIAELMRTSLGDWRERIEWPAAIFDDIYARGLFYEERGFDPALTNFPSPAFEESIEIAGLSEPVPRVIEVEDYAIPANDAADESGFQRTIAAQGKLLRFEHHLRRFIDAQMRAAFGDNWIDSQVDPDTRGQWEAKKKEAEERGAPVYPLIDYADFTDYERVIFRRDNWRTVFLPVFKKQESVRESLQRLHPVRLCSYHARLITQDDELLLHIEVKRILTAIGILKPH